MQKVFQQIEEKARSCESALSADQSRDAIRDANALHDRLLAYRKLAATREANVSLQHLDYFDSKGVHLWNKSTLLRAENNNVEHLALIAACNHISRIGIRPLLIT